MLTGFSKIQDNKQRSLFRGMQFYFLLCMPFFTCIESQSSNAIPAIFSVEQLTMDTGLPSNQIRKIHQDKNGFLWFLTDRGLVKYNGYECTVYENHTQFPDSLSSNELNAILEDDHGIFWIGSIRGLNRFDPKTGTCKRFLHDPANPDSINGDNVTDILLDRKGRYWISAGGLNLFDPEKETFTHFLHDPGNPKSIGSNQLKCLAEDACGKLWIGAIGSSWLEQLDPETGEFTHFGIQTPDAVYPDVISLYVAPSGIVWYGTWNNGLYRFDPGSKTYRNYRYIPGNPSSLASNIVQSIHPNGKDRLWIGTREGGFYDFDPKTEQFQPIKLVLKNDPNRVMKTVTHILQDKTGIVWMATLYDGVLKYDINQEHFLYFKNDPQNPESLSNNRVFALCTSRDGTVWIGTDGGGLNHYDPKTGLFTHYVHDPSDPASLTSNTVVALFEDRKGNLWIGSWLTKTGPFSRFIPETQSFRHYPNEPDSTTGLSAQIVRSISEDDTGLIWIGTDGEGINIFDPTTEIFKHYKARTASARGLNDTYARCFFEDHSKSFWIGTEHTGLLQYDRRKDRFIALPEISSQFASLATYNIMAIHEDREYALWLGTENGLIRINPERTGFSQYTKENGLADNVVKGILEDDAGYFWLSMDNGKMSRFHPKTKLCSNFDRNDGLQGLSFVANCTAKGNDGGFYFGGINGLNCIFPGKLALNTHIPSIVITAFEVMGKPYPFNTEGKTIELNHRQNFLSFSFAAVSYTQPQENKHAYRLLPLEQEWNISGDRRFARYIALEPGNYVFQVKGSNNDDVWNEEGVSLPIYIKPPFWRTWWFKTICIGLFFVFPFLVYGYRIQYLKKQRKRLEQEVKKRTEELYEANRTLDLLSKQDGLTKVANRRCFDEQICLEWRRALRNQSYLSLIFIDVDFFKRYNDHYGHPAGDECLQKIAEIFIKQVKRPGDLAARYGGEEFVIILIGADLPSAISFAEQLRKEVEFLSIPHEESDAANVVTISLGTASVIPQQEDALQHFIQSADQALYNAKHNGRNRVGTCLVD